MFATLFLLAAFLICAIGSGLLLGVGRLRAQREAMMRAEQAQAALQAAEAARIQMERLAQEAEAQARKKNGQEKASAADKNTQPK